MASSSSPQQQHVRQYVSSMLSQEGNLAFPYDEEVKSLIQQQLVTLAHDFPSLHIKSAEFTHDHGATLNLLQAKGTIPMKYHGIVYNIPITIWLVEDYPVASPLVFVTPTPDMVIKRPHEHVDGSGNVSISYLSNWMYPQSNLVDLARNLSSLFGHDPPLYSIAVQASNLPTMGRPVSPPSFGYQSTTPPSTGPSLHESGTEGFHDGDPSEVFRNNATNALAERIKLAILELQKVSERDIDKLGNTQIQLQRGQTQLTEAREYLQREKENLEQKLQILTTNTDVIHMWIYNNRKVASTIEIDDAFEPCDPLSKQLLECKSADNAFEDLLYCMDKAVQTGSIPVDAYLRQVRILAREQFFHRATCEKVQEAQTHMQVSRMAARYAS